MRGPEPALGRGDSPRRLAVMVGLVVVGLAVALGVFIQLQRHAIGPPEDVPRSIAIPALYATAGLLAVMGALQRRRAIVVAAGVLCLLGMILSVATIAFAIPGLALIVLAARIGATRRRLSEGAVAAGVIVLVVGAATILLGTTEGRCWEARGSLASPTYTVTRCEGQTTVYGGGQTIAGGYNSGVLTMAGGLLEAALLGAALTLVVATRPA